MKYRQGEGSNSPRPGRPALEFHNGFAATLRDVVEFYDTRFLLGLSEEEKADLVAFLRAL